MRMAQESFQRACTELNGKKTEIERLENQVELERQAGTANRGWSIGGLWNGDPRSRGMFSPLPLSWPTKD